MLRPIITDAGGKLCNGLCLFVPLALSAVLLAGPAGAAEVETESVDCNAGQTITEVLNDSELGEALVIVVSGDCVENVVIERDDVTLIADETSGASIAGANALSATIRIRGDRIRIEGFNAITGGQDGIRVHRGASARIVGNTIRNVTGNGTNLGYGILQNERTYTRIEGNEIRDNPRGGILVVDSSASDIVNNVIADNVRWGIFVSRVSTADVDGNTITGNGRDGVGVFWNSHLRLSNLGNSNLIEGNARRGVACASNSSADFRASQNFGGGNGLGDTSFDVTCSVRFQ